MQQQPMEDTEVDGAQETFETMVAGLVKHIFGAGEQGIRQQLKGSQDIPRDVGSLTYTMVAAAAAQAEDAQREVDLDMLFGVCAEVIDSLLQLAEAIGVIETADDDAMRAGAMVRAVEAYIASADTTPEEAEAAKQMLAQFSDSGETQEAASYIKTLGEEQGVEPFAQQPQAPGGPPVDGAAPAGQPPSGTGRPRAALMQG